MALVLFGVCAQETNEMGEAQKALRKATTLAPDLPLAWKGLASLYEKLNKESTRKDLLEVYKQLFRLENDPDKFEEWTRKIGILLSLLDLDTLLTSWIEVKALEERKRLLGQKMISSVVGNLSDNNVPESILPLVRIINT